jgi:hypothetical protein
MVIDHGDGLIECSGGGCRRDASRATPDDEQIVIADFVRHGFVLLFAVWGLSRIKRSFLIFYS